MRWTETGAIADLDPFIVNLADSPEVRYLKVTMKLELTNASPPKTSPLVPRRFATRFWSC